MAGWNPSRYSPEPVLTSAQARAIGKLEQALREVQELFPDYDLLACEMVQIPEGNWEDPDETMRVGYTWDGDGFEFFSYEETPQ